MSIIYQLSDGNNEESGSFPLCSPHINELGPKMRAVHGVGQRLYNLFRHQVGYSTH